MNVLASLLCTLAAAVAPPAQRMPATRPADGSVIVSVTRTEAQPTDETRPLPAGNAHKRVTADEHYESLKAELDAQFSRMFDLKEELDAANEEQQKKWEEYHLLRAAYERKLKRLIAQWVLLQS
jgi:hypothetical protein